MNGLRALGTICASLAAAVALCALACLLPDDPYQRWQLTDGTIFDQARWAYERIHYDDRPVDVAIVGPSKALLGLSARRIEQQLAARGEPANVANFAVIAAGRNIQWAVLDELFKTKAPKVVVLAVDGEPIYFGHPAFKLVAPAKAVVFPPAPLLHNYFYDLAHLPSRQLKLFAANLAPDLFGLRKQFDPQIYAATRSDFSSGVSHLDNKTIDMDREVSAEALRAGARRLATPSLLDRFTFLCCNDGDDHVYIRLIAALAKTHDANIIFVFFPFFDGSRTIADREFLSRYGLVLDNGDLSRNPALFQSWSHLNHAGAMIASDRVGSAIADLRLSSLDPPNSK